MEILVNTVAEHIAFLAVLKRFSGTRARRLRQGKLNGNFGYWRSFPLEAFKAMSVGAIALHAQRLVCVHREQLVNVRESPLDGSVVGKSPSPHVDSLMVFPK